MEKAMEKNREKNMEKSMEKIASFKKNHDILQVGLYESGTANFVTTFDLRFKKPNGGDYLDYKSIHSIEHIIATVVRNSKYKDDIIYFGPMGCRTGFYLLTINLTFNEVKELLIDSIDIALTLKEVPGREKIECGNYLEHDFNQAIKDLKDYQKILKNIE